MAIRLISRTAYRSAKTGRFTKKRKTSHHEIHKLVTDADTGRVLYGAAETGITDYTITVPTSGDNQGLINQELSKKRLLHSDTYRDATEIEIILQGKNKQGERVRLRQTIHPQKEQSFGDLMTGRITSLLDRNGYRPQYKLEVVDWSAIPNGLKKQCRVKRRKELLNVKVLIKIHKSTPEVAELGRDDAKKKSAKKRKAKRAKRAKADRARYRGRQQRKR